VGVAQSAVRCELGGGRREVAVALGVGLASPEWNWVRGPCPKPGIHRSHMDVGVAGQGTAPIANGRGRAVGLGAGNGVVEDNGPAGQSLDVGRPQEAEVVGRARTAIRHAVAGVAGDGIGHGHWVVGA